MSDLFHSSDLVGVQPSLRGDDFDPAAIREGAGGNDHKIRGDGIRGWTSGGVFKILEKEEEEYADTSAGRHLVRR